LKEKIKDLLETLEKQDKLERLQGLPASKRMRSITPKVGRFLYLMVQIIEAKTILEIGTSTGYSTIWLGLAAQKNNGEVITLEMDSIKIAKARENFQKAELTDIVTIMDGEAKKTITQLQKKFDLVFIDAEKEDYKTYFDLILPKVKSGGLIIADNVISHKEILQNYSHYVQNHPAVESITLPIGRGEELTLKIAKK
jgi:predicted O-methyltransferase YrrM